jgi:nucleotide-binding universal stress UspA family protein
MFYYSRAATRRKHMYKHILIPTDGSDVSMKGVEHGLGLAKSLGSQATIITATEPFPIVYGRTWNPTPEAARSFEEENNRAATQIFEKALARASELGVEVQTVHVANSAASTAILDKALELDCDLIVMASHGRSGLNKLLLGSQTNVVVKTSPVPVLVVR